MIASVEVSFVANFEIYPIPPNANIKIIIQKYEYLDNGNKPSNIYHPGDEVIVHI